MTPQVYSLRAAHRRIDPVPDDAVYCGRGNLPHRGDWGNPFPMSHESERASVIASYIGWLVDRLRAEPDYLVPLKGKNLSCWCHGPTAGNGHHPCHADILLFLANDPRCIQCGGSLDLAHLSAQNFRKCSDCAVPQEVLAALKVEVNGFIRCPRCDYWTDSPTFLHEHWKAKHQAEKEGAT